MEPLWQWCCGQVQQLTPFVSLPGGTRYSKYHNNAAATTELLCSAWLPVYYVLSTLQAQLVARNMDKSITHQAVVQLSEVFRLLHVPQSLPWKWKCALPGFKVCHLIFLTAGSQHAETRNSPLEKETGALHGPKPSTFVFSLSV